MGLKLLTAALKAAGGADLAGDLIKGVGGPVLEHIGKKIGIEPGQPGFDAAAAAHVEAMGLQFIEELREIMRDRQHARDTTMNARSKMEMQHQQWADKWNLIESLFMSIGGIILVVGSLVTIGIMEAKFKVEFSDFYKTLITAVITFMTRDLIAARSAYKHGTTHSSAKKTEAMNQVLEREQKEDANFQSRVVAQMSTERPRAPQPVAAAPDDDLFAPDLDDTGDDSESIDTLISTERRPT